MIVGFSSQQKEHAIRRAKPRHDALLDPKSMLAY